MGKQSNKKNLGRKSARCADESESSMETDLPISVRKIRLKILGRVLQVLESWLNQ